MEGSLLSRPEVIEASKKFVRIRLNSHEDTDHAALLIKLDRALSGNPARLNIDLFLLDPTGEKVLFKKGARLYPVFMKEEGGVPGILAQMENVARMYPGKAPEASLVPWNKSLSGAMVRAHSDAEPALLLITDGSENSKSLEKVVGDPALLKRFRTEFFFVRLDKGSAEIAKYKLPNSPGLLFVRPARLGTEAVVMDTKASPEYLSKSMESALSEFGKTFEKLSRQQILDKGKKENIHQPGAGPSRPGTTQ